MAYYVCGTRLECSVFANAYDGKYAGNRGKSRSVLSVYKNGKMVAAKLMKDVGC
jgi:hypothetical protein